jgi:hypothetical protein
MKEIEQLEDSFDEEKHENDFRGLDDEWLDWEDDVEDKKPLKRREKKHMRAREKEKTIMRKKQRERKIIYRSGDVEVPLYGYDEDWE